MRESENVATEKETRKKKKTPVIKKSCVAKTIRAVALTLATMCATTRAKKSYNKLGNNE